MEISEATTELNVYRKNVWSFFPLDLHFFFVSVLSGCHLTCYSFGVFYSLLLNLAVFKFIFLLLLCSDLYDQSFIHYREEQYMQPRLIEFATGLKAEHGSLSLMPWRCTRKTHGFPYSRSLWSVHS